MKLEHYKAQYWRPSIGWIKTPFSPEEGLSAIHQKCGCAGYFDCDCVSVVNQAQTQLWTEHNSKHRVRL